MWPYIHKASLFITNSWSLLNSCPSQWCHPLSSPSPPTFNLSQHQGLFQWISSSQRWESIFKRWEHQTTVPASWEIIMHVKKQQLELDVEQQTVSKWGKEYVKAVYSRGNTIYPHSSVGKESACSAGDPGEGIGYPLQYSWAQMVKNLPAMWETWVRSLGWEDPLERGKATYSSNLAWRIPWTI